MSDRHRKASIQLPPWFDPDVHDTAKIEQQLAEKHGGTWVIDSLDLGKRTASLRQVVSVDTVLDESSSTKRVNLAQGRKASDGPEVAQRMADLHPGYVMTQFEPLKGYAILSKLDPETIRARDAIATALGAKPWDIHIEKAKNGGYDFTLPSNYIPSRHDKLLSEVAQTAIGEPGWWVKTDATTLKAAVRPGAKATLPVSVPYPTLQRRKFTLREQMSLPIGVTMEYGSQKSRELCLDLYDNAGVLVSGTPGSGKSVTINALIAGALERGWLVGIGDVPHKEGDFRWVKDYVHPNWYGPYSKDETLTVAEMVYAVRDERKRLLDQYYVDKWNDLPDEVRPAPILLVVDELTGLFSIDKLPTGIPKDSTTYRTALQENLITSQLKLTIQRIALELRFVGVRLLLATQQAQGNTGISVPLKMAVPNRILLGAKADKRARGHAFQDPDNAAEIPANIRDDTQMSRGAGVAEIEGVASVVFKSYYGSSENYRDQLAALGIPKTDDPRPTVEQMDKYLPLIDDDEDKGSSRPKSRLETDYRPDVSATEPRLRGAAKAAHNLRQNAEENTHFN